jgi:hypothetical protein
MKTLGSMDDTGSTSKKNPHTMCPCCGVTFGHYSNVARGFANATPFAKNGEPTGPRFISLVARLYWRCSRCGAEWIHE